MDVGRRLVVPKVDGFRVDVGLPTVEPAGVVGRLPRVVPKVEIVLRSGVQVRVSDVWVVVSKEGDDFKSLVTSGVEGVVEFFLMVVKTVDEGTVEVNWSLVPKSGEGVVVGPVLVVGLKGVVGSVSSVVSEVVNLKVVVGNIVSELCVVDFNVETVVLTSGSVCECVD